MDFPASHLKLTRSALRGSSVEGGIPEAAAGTKTVALTQQELKLIVPSSFSWVVWAE